MATSREMEEYGVVPIHFRFFFPGLETALHPAIHYPGGGIYQSCHAFRCLGDDCPDTGQPTGCSSLRLSGCFGDPTAWIFADAFLIPAFIYVYRRILRMKKN